MGLSAQGRRRSARRGTAEFSGRRKARVEPGARAARYRGAERSELASLPACGDAVRQMRLHRQNGRRAARREREVRRSDRGRLENPRVAGGGEPVDGGFIAPKKRTRSKKH